MYYLLSVVAIMLLIIIAPIAIVYVLCLAIMDGSNKKFSWYMKATAKEFALSIDRFWNVLARDLFNDLLIQHYWYKFGAWNETISSVLWKNKRDRTLKNLWKMLADTLDSIV
jgi:hypothetical protein